MGNKTGALLLGGMVGAIIGVAIAWIFISEPAEEGEKTRRKRSVPWGEVMKMLLAVLGLARQIADLRRKAR